MSVGLSRLHFEVVGMISEATTRLRMTNVAFATACTLYHRFFACCDIKDVDPYTVAMAAISIASRVEEQIKSSRDVVNVCYNIIHKEPLEIGSELDQLRDSLQQMELFFMRVLAFKVALQEHPHKFLVYCLESLSKWFAPTTLTNSRLANVSMALLRDSYYNRSIILECDPHEHAVSVIHLALQLCGLEVPGEHYSQVPWWKALCSELRRDKIDEIQLSIMDVYKMDDKIDETVERRRQRDAKSPVPGMRIGGVYN